MQIIDENSNQNASDSSHLEIKNRDYKEQNRAHVIEKDEQDNEIENYSQKNEYYHETNSNLNYYDSCNNDQEQHDAKINFFSSTQDFKCRKCKTIFFSNNQLHKHLRQNFCIKQSLIFKSDREKSTAHLATNISIVEFFVDFFKNIDIDFEFRDWTYAKTMISLSIKDNEAQICLDTECSVILTNRIFIKNHEAHYIIRRMITSLNVRELNINKHEIWEYIIAIIYFSEKIKQEKLIRKVIRREMHLIDDLKANMLIDNDILEFEDIFIDDVNNKATIVNCDMIILIEIRTFFKNMITKALHVRFITIISSHSMIIISIHHTNLSSNRDFLFESEELNVFIYAHIIDTFINAIITKNDSNRSVKILRNCRLEVITKIQYLNAFHANDEIREYVERKSFRTHKTSWFNRVLKTIMIAYVVVAATIASFLFSSTSTEIVFTNDVIVHNSSSQTIAAFFNLIDQYLNLWKSEEFVKLSENQWMRISLRFDWKSRVFEKIKIYSLEAKDKKLVNQIFDDFQAKKRLKFTIESTSFSYSIFVIWKTVNDKKKKRVIVDIRELNVIILSNAYSLFLQKNIIAAIKECQYLFVIDCAFFFYQ